MLAHVRNSLARVQPCVSSCLHAPGSTRVDMRSN